MKEIIIDNDRTLCYETNSFFRKMANAVLVPTLNILPVSTRGLLKKTHEFGREIIERATTHRAMEILYDRVPRPKANYFQNFFLSIWMSTNNSKALRNRLKLVKREIKNKIISLAAEKRKVEIISIASGSARAVLEAIDEIPPDKNLRLSATFIDSDREALSLGKNLAETGKFYSSFRWFENSAEKFFKTKGRELRFNIAEIVGLLEYLKDEEVVDLFSAMYRVLDLDGIVITSTIMNNTEKRFISSVLGWQMFYRSADELSFLLMSAGFASDKMKIYYEPQKIHCVIISKK